MKSYEEIYLLRTKDCDMNGEWRFSSILEALQETAGVHCDRMGCGMDDLRKIHSAWVLLRSEVRMDRYPRIGDAVSVETFHTQVRHGMFPRYFILRDEAGQIIGKASTIWTLMDLETRKTAAPDTIVALMPDNRDMKAPLPLPGRIFPLENVREEKQLYHPSYTDLDVNKHVNNAKYADLFCNLLGSKLLSSHQIQAMILNYNLEILQDQSIGLLFQHDEQQAYLAGLWESKPAFEIGCILGPRA